jgi:hypothetical protein
MDVLFFLYTRKLVKYALQKYLAQKKKLMKSAAMLHFFVVWTVMTNGEREVKIVPNSY